MKRRLVMMTLLFLLVVGSTAYNRANSDEEYTRIYFVSMDKKNHGSALGWEPYRGPASPLEGKIPGPRALIYALLAGPKDDDLQSPFPEGLTLESWQWDKKKKGNIQVRMSEQYSSLADISLTLADYCIVMTLAQIPEVETVEITSGGYSATYRSHQLLCGDEVMLFDELAVPGTERLPNSTLP